jgi:filamentous hemagglutinin family protein
MAHLVQRYALIGWAFASYLAVPMDLAQAQVMPDGSLPTAVTSPDNLNFTIDGGSRSGSNLFHSFSQFSVPTGGAAVFNNPADVQTIFSRVTGGAASNIDGLIQTGGSANLFLLNPSGIVFGPNTQLNIGGSFVGTTASHIRFTDGVEFSATNPTALLTMSVPIGIQMGANPAPIMIQGGGHPLTTENPILAPYLPLGFAPGLMVGPGNTIALVGGDLTLNAGVLMAPAGRVDLASLGANATLPITPNFQLGDAIGDRRDIQLTQKSLIDVNAIDAGSIQLQGRAIDLQSGSLLWVQNRGTNVSGDITVNATDRLTVDDSAPDLSSVSGIINESLAGNGGDINLIAPHITVSNGANIMSRAFGDGQGGNLSIATVDLAIIGVVPVVPDIFSTINGTTAGSGAGGDVTVMARNVAVLGGATFGTATFGSGHGGNLMLTADTVKVSGLTVNLASSSISVPTLGGSGDAGNLILNTRKLSLSEGGFMLASSIGAGNAGNVTINATESIDLAGVQPDPGSAYQTGIASAVAPPAEPYKTLFGLTATTAQGASGDLTINTPDLRVYDGADITVDNAGSGIVGNIYINTDRLTLKNGGIIAASSNSGQGGNIWLRSNLIVLNQNARIATAAGGIGDGGNLHLDVPIIVGTNNSDITANAVQGRGGKIEIVTQGLFGLKFRPQLTPENDITASSEFGVNGTVQVTTIGVNPNSGVITLPTEPIDPNKQVADSCRRYRDSHFIVTGRGGVPDDALNTVLVDHTWRDLRAMAKPSPHRRMDAAPIIVEATALQMNSQGQTELIAKGAIASPPIVATCVRSSPS